MYINVEVCAFIQSIKYIHKYIYKGNDCTTLQLAIDGNKVKQYLQGCYIGPSKAIQQLFEFLVYKKYPFIIQFAVYLLGEQSVYFQPDQSVDDIQQHLKLSRSTLTAFFKYNMEYQDGRYCLYQDFPLRYTFVLK